jgi:hypothetical protein
MSIEDDIIKKAAESLKENFDFQLTHTQNFGSSAESQVSIRFNLNNKEIKKNYDVEVSRRLNSSMIGQIALKQRQSQSKVVLITEYVPPTIAEKLRALNVPFIDANGNAYFNEPEFYIFVNSRGRNVEIRTPSPSVLFQPSGLQLLFVLLSIPNSENRTYRELAEISSISLGWVSEIMNSLQAEYFLVKEHENRTLFRKDELLKRWVQGFAETLSHKLSEIQFETDNLDWWEDIDLTDTTSCWSGEVAADKMTRFLKPTDVVIYRKDHSIFTIIEENKMRRVDKGNVKIRRRFWKFNESDIIAPPLLIYADLLATAESRNLEAAQIIYDEHLAGLIE